MKTRKIITALLIALIIAATGFQPARAEAKETETEFLDKAEEIRIRETAKVKELIEAAEAAEAAEEATEEATEEEPEQKKTYFKDFSLTAYIATGNPCADGVYPQTGHTAACNDPALWHKWIEVEGYGVFYVHDTGGMSSNVIDIFVGSYDEAIQFGRRSAGVYIIE